MEAEGMNWKMMGLSLIGSIGLALAVCGTAHTDIWVAFDSPEWAELPEWSPTQMVFTFDGGRLTINTSTISEDSGSGTESWTLLFSGDWAVLGTIDDSGSLVPDSYATFVYDGYGGYVDWVADTPSGYIAPLLLGASYIGDGAMTYEEYAEYQPTGYTVTGGIVLWNNLPMRQGERELYTALGHTFYADSSVQVPEPAGILAMLTGLSGFLGLMVRRRTGK